MSAVHLDIQSSALNLRRALLDDERDAVRAVPRGLSKVDPEQLKSTLKLFVATLDGQSLQALLMAGQGALLKTDKSVCPTLKKSLPAAIVPRLTLKSEATVPLRYHS